MKHSIGDPASDKPDGYLEAVHPEVVGD